MNILERGALFSMLALLSACGQSLVEFADSGTAGGRAGGSAGGLTAGGRAGGSAGGSAGGMSAGGTAGGMTAGGTAGGMTAGGTAGGMTAGGTAGGMTAGGTAGGMTAGGSAGGMTAGGSAGGMTAGGTAGGMTAGGTAGGMVAGGSAGGMAIDAGIDAGVDAGIDAGVFLDGGFFVLSTVPGNLAMNVPITTRPTATFTLPVNPLTITPTTFTLMRGLNPVPGALRADGGITATLVPNALLALNTTYTATITTGALSLDGGLPLANDYVWSFTTSACGIAPVVLGSAANFAVLAGSTVTSVGPTSVIGDLGVSPGTAVTGFPPGTVVGAQHSGTPTSAQGIADLTTAYNEAAGRTLCPVTVSGNLGGQTLTPGLYKSTSSLSISSGDLTLDAQGDSTAVFIFQMASTLTTTAGRQIILSGGAKATNIFWQVGTSATLGTTTVFKGTIMADQSITLNTGATLEGRALARIGGVSLASNSIVVPTP
ncbi:MAG: ice-binding family protein [Myxococcales bacterium]|nr:ice-binding family protein [Myxococcales bacterium]